MSTATLEPVVLVPVVPMDRLYRFPLDVYEAMVERGILTEHDNLVLLDGLLVTKMTKGDWHVGTTKLVMKALENILPAGWHVGKKDPIVLPSGPSGRASVPEPDVTVLRGSIRDYMSRGPRPGDIALVVEVAGSSLREDRAGLARLAWAGIPVAWIVNLNDRTVEVYSNPTGAVENARYRDVAVVKEDGEVPVAIDGREVGKVPARDVLP